MAWPLAARAQQPAGLRRIGVLMHGAATETSSAVVSCGLRPGAPFSSGWTEGQNVRIEVRWNAGDAQRRRIYAAQLIGLMPDVTWTPPPTNLHDRPSRPPAPSRWCSCRSRIPVAQGFVASLAKPGGNLTGFTMYEFAIGGKWVDLLKEIAPGLTRVACHVQPRHLAADQVLHALGRGRLRSSLRVQVIGRSRFAPPPRSSPPRCRFGGEPNGGLILPTDTFTRLRQKLIAEAGGPPSPAVDLCGQ